MLKKLQVIPNGCALSAGMSVIANHVLQQKKMKTICQIFHKKKIRKMKIEEMVNVFLNSTNFAPYALLTLAPPMGYALNLKALIKVSKVSLSSQLSYEILRSLFERKFDNTSFISPKKASQKQVINLLLAIYLQRKEF